MISILNFVASQTPKDVDLCFSEGELQQHHRRDGPKPGQPQREAMAFGFPAEITEYLLNEGGGFLEFGTPSPNGFHHSG